ncbi:organic cation transporter protein-like [Mya arenaria]|uniref:organic cation transporter protein-like n=1 Tax=Mya arenaria TaxID=6604 RepID=UPI0022E94145|nr:organic cation transporter protein-like [Mya arenaria]
MHYDEILQQIGSFGFYQKRVYSMLAFPCMSVGALMFVAYVVLNTPKHRCKIPLYENDTFEVQDERHARLINFTIPPSDDPLLVYDKCQVYDVTNVTSLEGYSQLDNTRLVKCSEWVYDKSVFYDTFTSVNNIVCEDALKTSHIQMFFFVGVFAGSLISGLISDRFGRTFNTCLCFSLTFVFAVAVTFSPGFYTFATGQFFIGACAMGGFTSITIHSMEMVGPEKRLWTGMLVEIFFPIGTCFLALMAYLIRSWQWTNLAIAIPMVFYLSFWWIIPESPRWLISKSRKKEALKIIQTAAKVNSRQAPDDVSYITGTSLSSNQGNMWHVLRSPVLLRRWLILCFTWMVVSMTYYGVTMNAGNIGGNFYLNFFLMGLVEIPGVMFAMLILDRLGRRWSNAGTMIAGGVACLSTIPTALLGSPSLQPLTITLALVGKASAAAAFAIVYMFTAEILPTMVRNVGLGTCSCAARIGGMLAPYIAKSGELIGGKFGKVEPLVIFGALSVIAGLMLLLLPETLGQQLPDTIKDGEMFGRKKNKQSNIETEVASPFIESRQ